MSGEVSAYFAPLSAVMQQIGQGRLRALGVTSPQRLSFLPEQPTVAENGAPGYQFSCWYGLMVPAKTPRPVVTRLFEEAQRAQKLHDVQEALARQGLEIETSASPEAFTAELKEESAAWAQVIKSAGIKAD